MAMLTMPDWKCPAWTQNASLVNTSSPEFVEVWQSRLRTVSKKKRLEKVLNEDGEVSASGPEYFIFPQLQGSIMVASVLQVLVGFSGLIGFLMRFIGPMTIAPTVSLIGLSLYDSAGDKAGSHWGISAM